jgi:hypothetical protein
MTLDCGLDLLIGHRLYAPAVLDLHLARQAMLAAREAGEQNRPLRRKPAPGKLRRPANDAGGSSRYHVTDGWL